MSKLMDSTIYAAAAKASAVEFLRNYSSTVHQFICITFSFISRKTSKAQHKSVLFIPGCWRSSFHRPSKSSAQTRTYHQPQRCPRAGYQEGALPSCRAWHQTHSVLNTLTSSFRCLSPFYPRQQDWIQLAAGHWHRSATCLDRRVQLSTK